MEIYSHDFMSVYIYTYVLLVTTCSISCLVVYALQCMISLMLYSVFQIKNRIENKGADQLHSNCKADQRLCFHYTRIVQFLYTLIPKFPASSHLLCLYSLVCVRLVLKPHSHAAAH